MLHLALALLALAPSLPLRTADFDKTRLAEIDTAVAAAIKRGDCPGAVVLVVHADAVVYLKAFGKRSVKPDEDEMAAMWSMSIAEKP